nr:reverse transcriptase domain-containing protein [Tanacetum cinerariifolium]
MSPRMRTRSVGQPVAKSHGGGTGERVGRCGKGRGPRGGSDERVNELNSQGNKQGLKANRVVQGVNRNVGNQGNDGNQNGEFCPSHEMQKSETELWNYAMVKDGHATYTDRFHELDRLVLHLVIPESKKIKRYVYGLAPQISKMVAATKLKTIQKGVQISGALT